MALTKVIGEGLGTLTADVTVGNDLNVGTTSDSASQINFLATTSGASRINFGDSGDADIGVIQYEHDGNAMVFKTNASERMRIDTDGKIGINTTSPQEQIHSANSGTNALRVSGAGVNNAKVEIGYDNSAGPYIKAGSSGQTDLHIYTDNTALAAEFRANGDFYSNDGTVHSLSDIRIKKDVADLTDGLDIVKQLKPKTFKYTEDSEFYNEKTKDKIKYGFVANEVEAVAPQYTDTGKGSIGGKEVNDFKSLSTTKMLPMLVKAIQELSTALDAAVARIKELEDG